MKPTITPLLAAALLSGILASCGRIAIHSNPELTGPETGVKFYSPKPYILVKRTGAKAKPVEIEVVYLPDLENPLYAKAVPGIGSSDLDLTFKDGILTTLGQNTDPKISDLISTLAGVPGSLADADKTRAETAALEAQASSVEISNAAQSIKGISSDIDTFLSRSTTDQVTTLNQRNGLKRISSALLQHAASLSAPGAEARLAAIVKSIEGTAKQLSVIVPADGQNLTDPGRQFWGMVKASKEELASQIKVLKPKTPQKQAPETVTLYEIVQTPAGTILKEVGFQ